MSEFNMEWIFELKNLDFCETKSFDQKLMNWKKSEPKVETKFGEKSWQNLVKKLTKFGKKNWQNLVEKSWQNLVKKI